MAEKYGCNILTNAPGIGREDKFPGRIRNFWGNSLFCDICLFPDFSIFIVFVLENSTFYGAFLIFSPTPFIRKNKLSATRIRSRKDKDFLLENTPMPKRC